MNPYALLRSAQRDAPRVALTYAIAGVAGYLAMRLSVPLPWMMGALLATAAQALSGFRPSVLPVGRRVGQMMIAIGVGLTFTQDAALAVLSNLPAMTAAAILTMAAGALIAQLLARAARIDQLTAVMSSVPGGPADMANLAERYGGDPLTVALSQTFRIALIVTCIPPAMILSGIDGHQELSAAAIIPFNLLGLLGLGLIAAGAIAILGRIGLVSVPMAAGTNPAATAAPEPEDDPPGRKSVFQGFSGGGQGKSQEGPPRANSKVPSLPRRMPPAFSRRAVTWASAVAGVSGIRREWAVVGTPSASTMSFRA